MNQKKYLHPKKLCFVVLGFGLAPFLLGILPTTRFVREQIDIQLYESYITVTGRYVYKNVLPIPVVQGLSIPFHVDFDHAPPIFIRASEFSPRNKNIQLHYIMGRHRFDLKFRPLEQKSVEISYRQETPMKNGRYILKTTRPWKMPLVEGIYRIHLNGARLIQSNYPMFSEGKGVFTFTKRQFMPTADWEFAWEL